MAKSTFRTSSNKTQAKHPELVEGCDLGKPASFDGLRMLVRVCFLKNPLEECAIQAKEW